MTASGSLGATYREFFERFNKHCAQPNGLDQRPRRSGDNFRHFATNCPRIEYSVSFSRDGFRVELAIEGPNRSINATAFAALQSNKVTLENALGPLVWYANPNVKAHRIYSKFDRPCERADKLPDRQLQEMADWACKKLIEFGAVFSPLVDELCDDR